MTPGEAADRKATESEEEPPADLDRQLLARVAAGDADALAQLYARHRSGLLAYLALLAPEPGLAEELVQDTLLAAWRGASRYAGRASVAAWLLGIARRRAHDARRRRNWKVIPGDEATIETMPAPAPSPEDQALINADLTALAAAVGRLAPAHREVLVLIFVHELPQRDVAEVLGVPVGTVKSRLFAAKHALRALLAPPDEGSETW